MNLLDLIIEAVPEINWNIPEMTKGMNPGWFFIGRNGDVETALRINAEKVEIQFYKLPGVNSGSEILRCLRRIHIDPIEPDFVDRLRRTICEVVDLD